jgi:hypothetical protein
MSKRKQNELERVIAAIDEGIHYADELIGRRQKRILDFNLTADDLMRLVKESIAASMTAPGLEPGLLPVDDKEMQELFLALDQLARDFNLKPVSNRKPRKRTGT